MQEKEKTNYLEPIEDIYQEKLKIDINDNKRKDTQEDSISDKEKDKDSFEENKEINEESKPNLRMSIVFDKIIDDNSKNKKNEKLEQKINACFGGHVKKYVEMYNNKNKEPVKKDNKPKLLKKQSIDIFNEKKEDKFDEKRRYSIIMPVAPKRKSIGELAKIFQISNDNKKAKGVEPVKEDKIFPKSEILSKENPNMTIYKYPNIQFSEHEDKNCKIILFLGGAQHNFINAFINIYRNISFKDNFRYKIDSNIKQNEIMIYDIKAYDIKKNYNIKIISIPFCKEKNKNYIINLLEVLKNMTKNIKNIKSRINLICYTFEESISDLNINHLNEIKFYKYFVNFLNIRDKLLFLCSANESLEQDNKKDYIINLFNFDKNDYLYEEKVFKDDFIFINSKFIYENDNNTENNWNILMEKFQLIQDKIKTNKAEYFEKEKFWFFDDLLIDKVEEIKVKLNKFKYKEAFLFIYFLQIMNFNEDKSNIILYLYNRLIKDIHSHKKIDTDDNELIFIDDKIGNKALNFLSKLNFKNLQSIHFHNCSIVDKDIYLLKNLITSNLEYLDLSKNQIQNLNTLFENDVFSNLKMLNLSNNNIINISSLSNIKFNNLEKLYLNSNKIIDIECFELNDNFDKLKLLDLSCNNITKLKKTNIKSLEELYLLNNDINSGINDFFEHNNFSEVRRLGG